MQTYYIEFITDESGQGITEYGAILAFTSVIIALGYFCVGGHGMGPWHDDLGTAIWHSFKFLEINMGKLLRLARPH